MIHRGSNRSGYQRARRRYTRVGVAALIGFFAVGALISLPAMAQTALEEAATNPQQSSLATNIVDICPRLAAAGGAPPTMGTLPSDQQDLFDRCNGAIRLANAGQTETASDILGQIAAEEVIAQESLVNGTLMPQSNAITARISALSGRLGGGQIARLPTRERHAATQLASTEPVQIAADGAEGSFDTDLGLGVFFTADYNFGEKDETSLEAGFDFDDISLTGGADYFLTDKLVVGLAAGYSNAELEFDNNAGELDGEAYTLAAYSLWTPLPQLGLKGYLSYGHVDYESKRNLAYTDPNGTVARTALGETDVGQFEATGGAYYDFTRGPWTFGPTLDVSYLRTDMDGFTETGAQGLDLVFEDQEAESFQTRLGGAVSRAFSTGFGVAVLQARAQWIHEFADDSRTISVRYENDPFADSPAIVLTTDEPDRDRALVGAGVSFVFAGGISAFADFETMLFHEDVETYTATAGLRISF